MLNMWKTIEADGCVWHVRSVSNPDTGLEAGQQVLEFQAQEATRPPRRIVVDEGSLDGMDDAGLQAAFARSLPIGGDHYGRPGKRMTDTGGLA
jgi:hypothetical protein